MTLYELLLFIHVGGSIVWIGAGFLSLVLAFIRPASERIGAEMEQQGGRLTPELRVRIRKLIAMALILAAGIAYILVSLRAIDARAAQPSSA
jgi:uncharacterized membrane protein